LTEPFFSSSAIFQTLSEISRLSRYTAIVNVYCPMIVCPFSDDHRAGQVSEHHGRAVGCAETVSHLREEAHLLDRKTIRPYR
jgi:hypothetical protein